MNIGMEKALQAVVKGVKADGRSINALKRRGLIDEDGTLTHAGRVAYLDSVECADVYTLTLGTPLYKVQALDGKFYKIDKGAVLVALYAGMKKHQKWYDCFVSTQFPIVRVLYHRSHKVEKNRVPLEELQ